MTRGTKALVATTGTLAAALLVLSGVMVFGGEEDEPAQAKPSTEASRTPGPAPTYTQPADWVEPDRWAVLPRPAETNKQGLGVGFEDSELGAVSMLVTQQTHVAEGAETVAKGKVASFLTYASQADRMPEREGDVRASAEQVDDKLRQVMGMPAEGDYPPGASVATRAVGFKVYHSEGNEVGAYLLSKTTYRSSETAKEQGGYSVMPLVAIWEAGDWKLSSAATKRLEPERRGAPVPKAASPGDTRFNAEGWTAIREAS